MTAPIPGGEYLATKEAVIALSISKATLYRRKNEGFFQRGVHSSPLVHLPPPIFVEHHGSS